MTKRYFRVEIDIDDDDVARTEEPYYVTLDIEGKEYEVTDIRPLNGDE